jgi:hypothetical protein
MHVFGGDGVGLCVRGDGVAAPQYVEWPRSPHTYAPGVSGGHECQR